MGGSIDWSPVAAAMEEGRSFLVTSHVNPEGDAIGSEMALVRFLRQRGKTVRIVNPSPTPENCRFLDPEGEIIVYDPSREEAVLRGVDTVFVLDLSSWDQLGDFAEPLRLRGPRRVCIDHHRGPDEDIAEVLIRDTSAAAAGLLVYEMIRELGGDFDAAMVEALYATIIIDTGSFHFSNTDARALRAAADLVERGARPDRIYRYAFEDRRWASAKLLAPVLSTLDRTGDGRIAWIHVTREMIKKANGRYEDVEGFIEIPRGVRGVEVCAFFKEHDPETIRISLRSNGDVDLHRFAQSHGGGGHSKAAGITFQGSLEEAIRGIVSGLEALVGG
ncbi:MAG: bifunctional oligoribonuclease/PAP phosphatase NrnA [Candidatus Eisenbacteria bacterium]|nr:bifunctional oligoribonuclease/PAP phosphatase NrnA [Candidatus Eisenbacteria bacterium]